MVGLFNTPDGAEVLGVNSDREFGLEKAKKGSPQYEEWLRKYREKRSGNPKEQKEEAKRTLKDKSSEDEEKYKKMAEEKDIRHLASEISLQIKDIDIIDDSVDEIIEGLKEGGYYANVEPPFNEYEDFDSRDAYLDACDEYNSVLEQAADKVNKILPKGWEAEGFVDAGDFIFRITKTK